MDGAILHDASELLRNRWASQSAHPVFSHSAGDEARRVGPLLFQNPALYKQASWLYHPFDLASSCMLGSTLVSPLDRLELSKRLSPLLDVVLADGVNMVMRFFDPRVLPFWLGNLPLPYRDYLAGFITEWIYLDTSWNVRSMSFGATPATEQPDFPLKLEQETEDRLMDACFPYWLMGRLRPQLNAAAKPIPATDIYRYLHQQIQRARSHGLQAASDLETYCSLSLQFGEHFDEHRLFKRLWPDTAVGKSLPEVLGQMSESDWQEMRKSLPTQSNGHTQRT